jgi:hypothetical protein
VDGGRELAQTLREISEFTIQGRLLCGRRAGGRGAPAF